MGTATIVFAEPLPDDPPEGIVIPPSAYTLAGFRAWAKSDDFPERGRFAFIGGQLYVDLTMEEIETHNKVKTEIIRVLANINVAERRGELYSDGVLIANTDAEVSNEPDAGFVLWETFEAGRAHRIAREGHEGEFVEIEGSPDWLLEIVSASSVKKDTRVLREHYHRARVQEYWLVNARQDPLDFQILHWAKSGYEPAENRDGWQWSAVFRRWFKLVRRRGRLGLWEYELLTRKALKAKASASPPKRRRTPRRYADRDR